MTGFPRSYHVLYWLAQAFNIGVALAFGGLGVFGVKASPWWYLALLPGWVFFAAWRVVARAYFKRRERELGRLWGEVYAERQMLLALQARMEGREQ